MQFAITSVLTLVLLRLTLAGETPLTQSQSEPQPTSVAIASSNTAQQQEQSPLPPHTTPFPETIEEELKRRQNPGQVVGEGVASAPTQQSPITTFYQYDAQGRQTPVVFTQLFSAVPDQWDDPKPGTIGLGTIQGTIGAVKSTKAKRNLIAAATELAKRGIMAELEKRAKGKGGSGGSGNKNGTNAAVGAYRVPFVALGGAAAVAVAVVNA